jgi:hypothetical protein
MYTWGDMQEVILAKLDLGEEEAEIQNLVSRFPYFANEAMTQICSIKPKHTFFEAEVDKDDIGNLVTLPGDFIAFGDDVNKFVYSEYNETYVEDAYADEFDYVGYNQVLFKRTGKFYISYNARWVQSFVNMEPDLELADIVPRDILDCIPSYVASQCMKIDDEYKSSVYRNEYEVFLARLDDTDFKSNKTFKIEGDW